MRKLDMTAAARWPWVTAESHQSSRLTWVLQDGPL